MKKIYLASIYSLDAKTDSQHDRIVRAIRARYAMKRAAELMKEGFIVYCPIAHCHQLGVLFNLPKDFSFWKETDHSFIDSSDAVMVLDMKTSHGKTFADSEGITSEIRHAAEKDKAIIHYGCSDYDEVALVAEVYENGGKFPYECI